MMSNMPENTRWDKMAGPPSSPEQARARHRQQASQARLDHALGLIDLAIDAATHDDQSAVADLALAPPIARWIRLCVGMAADEYQLTNAEMEAVERVRGGLHPDRESDLATWLAAVDQRPRIELLREGTYALAWLRGVSW
jgi:hypothetical protein